MIRIIIKKHTKRLFISFFNIFILYPEKYIKREARNRAKEKVNPVFGNIVDFPYILEFFWNLRQE